MKANEYIMIGFALSELANAISPIKNRYTYKRKDKKIGRNELCICGSGKKYKKCCINRKRTK